MNQTLPIWPVISIAVNMVMALILFSLRSALRIAVLELKEVIAEKYATKDYVDQQVSIARRIETGFADVKQLLRGRVIEGTGTPQR